MRKTAGLLAIALFAMGLASCTFPMQPSVGTADSAVVGQYMTVSVLLTKTAQGSPSPKPVQPGVTASARQETRTGTPVVAVTQRVTAQATNAAAPCDLARAGIPIDVTIPDDTRVRPGEYFSKTWRLVNAGNCAWSRDYAIVWFSGDEIGLTHLQRISSVVAPGQSVDVTVDMQAPKTPGVYQSNWKLMNNQGLMFGIGPEGSAPFWVRVMVVPVVTDTPTVTPLPPTATPTPVVFNSGVIDLPADSAVDLDSGEVNQMVRDDLRVQIDGDGQAQLLVENGARVEVYGQEAPAFTDCSSVDYQETPVGGDTVQQGAYVCFRTSEGLPGWVFVSDLDLKKRQVTLEFMLWAVP